MVITKAEYYTDELINWNKVIVFTTMLGVLLFLGLSYRGIFKSPAYKDESKWLYKANTYLQLAMI